jgi:dipeptidyl aminopeptidase/acylaminoacyl peptidase
MWLLTVLAQSTGYWRFVCLIPIWIVITAYGTAAQQKRAITPADCVTVRYLRQANETEPLPITISADGRRAAYLIKTPDLATNQNPISLFVKQISSDVPIQTRPILEGDISSLHWLKDSRHLMALVKLDGKRVIEMIDSETGEHSVIVQDREDIEEYSASADGAVVVFAVEVSETDHADVRAEDLDRGYLVPYMQAPETMWSREERLLVTRKVGKAWMPPEPIVLESPFTHTRLTEVIQRDGGLWLSLSPSGEQLLLQYFDMADALPERWANSPFVQYEKKLGVQGHRVLALYDLSSGKTTMPLETPFATSIALWSSDSSAFVIFGKPPVGSIWDRKEAKLGPAIVNHSSTADLFWVKPGSGKVEMVASHQDAPYPRRPPLAWSGGALIVGTLEGMLIRFEQVGDHWERRASLSVPLRSFPGYLAGDISSVIGDMQASSTPPELFIYHYGDSKVDVFANLNPQFDELALADTETVEWKTSTGRDVKGTLFLPPGHQDGIRYPLVIGTKLYGGNWFACDYGGSHFPSFIPEPLADAGIAYLGFYYPDNRDGKGLEDYYPKGYPGGIGEAAFEADVYDTAVDALSDRGLIDKERVGIIGFSRSGWYTEFALMFGRTHYLAATAADNVEYSLGEYFTAPLTGVSPRMHDSMFGGPPTGETLKNWLSYSITFNMDRIHTPLLMEEMGYGLRFDSKKEAPPITLANHFDVFTGLMELHKPVELYFYPDEDHQPDHPRARLGSLKRNLDWYRFWLQGYVRPDAEDPGQYKRWEALRNRQANQSDGKRDVP